MMLRATLLLLLPACEGPAAPVPGACPYTVDGWYGGAMRHLVHAGGAGAFDYTPGEPWLEASQGVWERHGCSFVATTRYASGYFLVEERTWGGGRLEANGDHHLSWGLRRVDVLGAVEDVRGEESRRGCSLWSRVDVGGEQVTTVAEILDDATVEGFITSTGSDFDVTATWHADHSAQLDYDGHDGESWYAVDEPGDGTRVASFHLAYDGGVEDGGYERGFDGTREYRFDRFPEGGDWSVMHIWWLLRYDGSGEGEVVGEAPDGSVLTCCYTWDAEGVGSYSCDDGSSGPY